MLEKTIKKLSRIFCIGLIAGSLALNPIASNSSRAEIYKYKDKNGVWHYTDGSADVPRDAETINEIQSSPRRVPLEQNLNDSSTNVRKQKSSQIKELPQAYVDSRNYKTVLHQGISLFSDLVNVDSDYRKLDDIIREAKKRIPKKARTVNEAVNIFRTIGNIISEKNYRFNISILNNDNCKASYIYAAVGESLDLPIYVVNAPSHIFVRYIINDKYINWDSTSNAVSSNSDYINRLNISQIAINNGSYLRRIKKSELLGMYYAETGISWWRLRHNPEKAISNYDQAINLSKRQPWIYFNRGITWHKKGNMPQALKDINQALRLDPGYKKAQRVKKVMMNR